jgi:hypothetical protein
MMASVRGFYKSDLLSDLLERVYQADATIDGPLFAPPQLPPLDLADKNTPLVLSAEMCIPPMPDSGVTKLSPPERAERGGSGV